MKIIRTLLSCTGQIKTDRALHAATVEIDEGNGSAAGTLTHNISNTNMSTADTVNQATPETNPVTPGSNTMEKWQKIHVTAFSTSTSIGNLKIWRTGGLGGAATHLTNARTASYGGAATGTTPVTTASTFATQTMPTSVPGTANLGIAGALATNLTATGSSDFLVHQIQTNAADVAGSTSTMNYQYDEVA